MRNPPRSAYSTERSQRDKRSRMTDDLDGG
jgi:hypothetical protein